MSAGINSRNPHGMDALITETADFEPNNSVIAVESQNVAIDRIAIAPAAG
jgi:hypothetical protein